MASSSLPSKLDLQALILDQELVKKFNLDARKFSRNYETSILFDKYSAGKVNLCHAYYRLRNVICILSSWFGEQCHLLAAIVSSSIGFT